jgi:hypothetical protein
MKHTVFHEKQKILEPVEAYPAAGFMLLWNAIPSTSLKRRGFAV